MDDIIAKVTFASAKDKAILHTVLKSFYGSGSPDTPSGIDSADKERYINSMRTTLEKLEESLETPDCIYCTSDEYRQVLATNEVIRRMEQASPETTIH